MATRVDQAYFGWPCEQSAEHDETQDVSDPQVLDHGSISFGRFQFESLEWERRSVFSHNKCQEELEKFKSPGLVAQKKAYFEEYYKKVRARKRAMEENQQIEVTSEYGGGDIISSETGKDYEMDVKLETIGDGASNVIDVHNTLIKSTLEGKHSTEAIQSRHFDPEDARKVSLDIEQGRDISYAPQTQRLDMGCMLHESLTRIEEAEQQDMNDTDTERISVKSDKSEAAMLHESLTQIEEAEQQDMSDNDTERISMKSDKSEATIEQEKNSCIYDVPIYGSESSDRQPAVLESLTMTEDIEHHEYHSLDIEQVSRKFGSLEADIEPVVSNRLTVLNPTNPNAEDSVLEADCNTVSEKDKPTVNRKKGDHVPVSKVKASASIKDYLKLDSKNQTATKSSVRSKYPFQRATIKANNGVVSGKTTDYRLSRNNKSSPVASPRSLAEVRSNFTTPRPFSFASEKRSAIPAFSRGNASKLSSKTPKGLAAPLNQSKDDINVQDNSKKASITYGAKSRGIENKRVCEQVRKGALALNKQSTNYKRRGTNMPGMPKNRMSTSLNLPAPAQSDEKVASESRTSGRKDKRDEEKEEANSREAAVGTKIIAPRTRNLRTESKKVASSQTNHLPFLGMKTKIGGLSHDGIKPRQEMPRWR